MVSPLGCGVDVTWARILKGESGARQIDTVEVADLPSRTLLLQGHARLRMVPGRLQVPSGVRGMVR